MTPSFHSQPLPLALKLFELWKKEYYFWCRFQTKSYILLQMMVSDGLHHNFGSRCFGHFSWLYDQSYSLVRNHRHSLVEIKQERLPSVLQTISNLKERHEYVDCWSILILVGGLYVFVWWFISLAHNR